MISIIVAIDKNFAIGKNNAMPWHLPADFAHFKEVTLGHPVIMGSSTYLSIGKPLPGRTNIVLTRKEKIEGCVIAHSLEEAFEKGKKQENGDVFVIGGASVYEQSLSYTDKLVVTHIDTEVEDADTFFPKFNLEEWKEISREKREADEKNEFNMEFVTYARR
ncbi:MAG: dihydrofolate reductase [Candidatus Pacebacteria bacterium]|nr:dihydrofolate reductase [Candidatus Paceibacterota bacterium]